MSEFKKMLSGKAHQPYSEELTQMRHQCKELLFDYNYHTRPSDKTKKAHLLALLLGKSDDTTHINAPFFCDYGKLIEVGKNFFANHGCTLLDSGGIRIGDNVMFAPNVALYTVGHPLDAELRNEGWEQAKPIVVEDNVWIGGNVVVLGGVTIGKNSMIGAGAVVNRDIPSNSLVVGNPAKVIRQITEQDKIQYQQYIRG